jgi:hypothetical protein
MNENKIYIKISPEVLKSEIFLETYTGDTGVNNFGIYSGMSYILSGGTNGTSLLTGLTIPIFLTQSYNDVGIYSEFDGLIEQQNVITNFLYSGYNPFNLFEVRLLNTSAKKTKKFLNLTNYTVDWGDGSPFEVLPNDTLDHIYNVSGNYTITLSGSNSFGTTIVQKPISIPLSGATVDNPNGVITYTPMGGSWPTQTNNLETIFQGDNNNSVSAQTSDNFTTVPFTISGFTKSKLSELRRYGPQKYTIGYQFFKNNDLLGQIDSITNEYTSYTINNISYFDFPNGKTFFVVSSSGITDSMIVSSAITKNEYLLDFVMSPEIQADVFVERGKYSPFESLERLGEVDNTGDMVRYGYGFFKINTI